MQEFGQSEPKFEPGYANLAEALRVFVGSLPSNLQLCEVFGWDKEPSVKNAVENFEQSLLKPDRVFLSGTMVYVMMDRKLWFAEIKDVPELIRLKDEEYGDHYWRSGLGPKRRDFLRRVFPQVQAE